MRELDLWVVKSALSHLFGQGQIQPQVQRMRVIMTYGNYLTFFFNIVDDIDFLCSYNFSIHHYQVRTQWGGLRGRKTPPFQIFLPGVPSGDNCEAYFLCSMNPSSQY